MNRSGPTIETERLTLRPHWLGDHAAFCAIRQDPRVFPYIGGELNDEACWNRLLRYAGHWSQLGFGIFAILERKSGRLIGETGFADFHRGLGEDFDGFPEAAWALAADCHGRGYAFEAAQAAHDWHGGKFGPGRTVCLIHPDNAPSFRVAERLGYRQFGERHYKGSTLPVLEKVAE
ncbi:MAG: GNAT family N-acetyltransferase [Sphingobium sp.]